ncbi:MAG: DUF4389 domain-containing protein [Armatimonadota bacterium]|nr:DUF4389 domain-containing protein [Armatimonadota bacterium]MDR7452117.1 DUF4389 domain-containing protein [Armatimonadota bacterium]MDR7467841.1 DUF4389 domain-containing protein [Armatimonadota bacterium]MDR7494729.1 DUF4389 domain-containing protein [Armatimonadota bacterium]MDR7499554.1 DUF4389 domain-containing protein [Armatimonadota bacterium]
MATQAAAAPAAYPLRFDVQYPARLSRGLIFVKWLLAIPHFLILNALGNFQGAITLLAFFAILFTRRYPPTLFQFYVKAARWAANVVAYFGLFSDDYPPFDWEAGCYPPVTFEVDYPQQLSRWMIFVKWLLALPHYVVLAVLYVVGIFAWLIAWFAILFTGRFPRGLFDFLVGLLRWSFRVGAYVLLLRDEYPPFSTA